MNLSLTDELRVGRLGTDGEETSLFYRLMSLILSQQDGEVGSKENFYIHNSITY